MPVFRKTSEIKKWKQMKTEPRINWSNVTELREKLS